MSFNGQGHLPCHHIIFGIDKQGVHAHALACTYIPPRKGRAD